MDSKEIKVLIANQELRNYFITIRELVKAGNNFCVDLDDVWELAYTRKDAAVRTLRKVFTMGEDYIIDTKKVPSNNGGTRNVGVIMMTSKCLEHFIAQKVPAVFEVYRKVFHEAIDQQERGMVVELPNFKNPADAARAWAHQFELREAAMKKVEAMTPKAIYHDKVLASSGSYTMDDMAKYFGFRSGIALAKALCKVKVLLKSTAPYKLSAKYIGQKHPEYVSYGTSYDGESNRSKNTLCWTEEGKRLIAGLKSDGKI